MNIKDLPYSDAEKMAYDWLENSKDKNTILALLFSRDDCDSCKYMIEKVFSNIEVDESKFEFYKVNLSDKSQLIPFRPLRTPITYFFVPNSSKMPIPREGAGPLDAVRGDMESMVKVMEGADYLETFFPNLDKESIPPEELN